MVTYLNQPADKRYNAEIVAGALLPSESRIIAKLILDSTEPDEINRLLTVDNVLQKRSPATAIRMDDQPNVSFSNLKPEAEQPKNIFGELPELEKRNAEMAPENAAHSIDRIDRTPRYNHIPHASLLSQRD